MTSLSDDEKNSPAEKIEPMTWKGRMLLIWRQTVRPILVIVVVLCSFRSAVADWNDVPTGSMKPTIIEGDRIFVNKLAYDLKIPFTLWRVARWSQPERGDVVVLFSPDDETRLVKRVVGIPGDQIELRNNRLLINGKPADYGPLSPDVIDQIEPSAQGQYRFKEETVDGVGHPVMLTRNRPSRSTFGPLEVPKGQYFVMGDNRDQSRDSRWFGFVSSDLIVGRSLGVVLSVDPEHYYMPRWGRFFRKFP